MAGIVELGGGPTAGERIFGMAMQLAGARDSEKRIAIMREELVLRRDDLAFRRAAQERASNLADRGMTLSERQYDEGAGLRRSNLEMANLLVSGKKDEDAEFSSNKRYRDAALNFDLNARFDQQQDREETRGDRMKLFKAEGKARIADFLHAGRLREQSTEMFNIQVRALKNAEDMKDFESPATKKAIGIAEKILGDMDPSQTQSKSEIRSRAEAAVFMNVIPGLVPAIGVYTQEAKKNADQAKENELGALDAMTSVWRVGGVNPGKLDEDTYKILQTMMRKITKANPGTEWISDLWDAKYVFPEPPIIQRASTGPQNPSTSRTTDQANTYGKPSVR